MLDEPDRRRLPRFVAATDGTACLALSEEVRPPFDRRIRVWDPRTASDTLVERAGATYRLPASTTLPETARDIALLDHAARSSERLAAPARSATRFYPHQFHPLIRYLDNSERRVLIADEVGLGKTIAAGYVLVEETARSAPRRTLVLCPSRLIKKWRAELWRRFGLAYETPDGARLLSLLTEDRPFHAIASIDAARTWPKDRLDTIETAIHTIDLTIIDEAHHLVGRQGETLRRRLGRAVSLGSRGLVALTATPVLLDPDDLARILSVLAPSRFDDKTATEAVHDHRAVLTTARVVGTSRSANAREAASAIRHPSTRAAVEAAIAQLAEPDARRLAIVRASPILPWMTRTRKTDVGLQIPRKITTREVELSEESVTAIQGGETVTVSERSLHVMTDALFREHFAFVHRAQLASSLHATLPLLRHGARGLARWPQENEGILAGMLKDVPSKTLDPETRERCERLAALGDLVGKDTKWDALVDSLRELVEARPARKIVVFTQWLPTQRTLLQRAQALPYTVLGLSGQHSDATQRATLRRFAEAPGPLVLVTTDVLSEGLDLIEADAIVNYDLPFNPQRVEQRIGRVDRIGQDSPSIDVVNLVTRDTLEARIHGILHERLHAFETTIGIAPDVLVERDPDEDAARIRALDLQQRDVETQARLEAEALRGADAYLGEGRRRPRDPSGTPAHALSAAVFADIAALVTTGRNAASDDLSKALATGRVEGRLPPSPLRALAGAQPTPGDLARIDALAARGFVLDGPDATLPATGPIVERAMHLLHPTGRDAPLHFEASASDSNEGTLAAILANVDVGQTRVASAVLYAWLDPEGTTSLLTPDEATPLLLHAATAQTRTITERTVVETERLARAWCDNESARALNAEELRLRADYGRTKARIAFAKEPDAAQGLEAELERTASALERLRDTRDQAARHHIQTICTIDFRSP